MSFRLNNRKRRITAVAVAGAALALLTGCAVDTQAIFFDSVSGISQAILDGLLEGLSSYLASS